jgi:hypothetical protein
LARSDKKLRELAAVLEKGNKSVILETVRFLKEGEPFEGAIALLAAFYDSASDKSLLKSIESFFNDIKYQSATSEVITEIHKPWKANTISMLISSCWQSGLDYSGYLADMAAAYLEADYATAIECMTVIEESVIRADRKVKDDIIKLVLDSPLAYSHEKSPLTGELISILRR